MKSDRWILQKIIEECVNRNDISFLKDIFKEGYSDHEILIKLRERIFSNAKGLLSYIRNEKVKALTLKLSYQIHWTYIFPVIREWLQEKEKIARWREDKHRKKVEKKAAELKKELLRQGYSTKYNPLNVYDIEKLVLQFEKAAEELLLEIEQDEI